MGVRGVEKKSGFRSPQFLLANHDATPGSLGRDSSARTEILLDGRRHRFHTARTTRWYGEASSAICDIDNVTRNTRANDMRTHHQDGCGFAPLGERRERGVFEVWRLDIEWQHGGTVAETTHQTTVTLREGWHPRSPRICLLSALFPFGAARLTASAAICTFVPYTR